VVIAEAAEVTAADAVATGVAGAETAAGAAATAVVVAADAARPRPLFDAGARATFGSPFLLILLDFPS